MRTLRFLAVPALLIFLASAARADDINIIFDPSPADPTVPVVYLSDTGPLTVSWDACVPGVPNGAPQIYNSNGCLFFNNNTGATINFLSLTFVVPSGNPTVWSSVTCDVIDSSLPNYSCPATITAGETVTLDFAGTSGILAGSNFYIAENGVTDLTQMPDFTVMVPTHDPNTLVLLLAGIAMLGMCGVRRYA